MRRRAAAPDRETATHDALGAVAVRLRSGSAPRAAFRAELRGRLLSDAAAPPATVRRSPWRRVSTAPGRPPRRVAAAGGALLALTLAGAAVVVGAGRSLPGQPLYAVQTAVEQVQLAAAGDPVARGVRHLRLAERRLRDVQALDADPAGAPAGLLVGTLDAMDAQTREGSDLLLAAGRGGAQQAPAAALRSWSVQQTERVRTVDPTLPAPAHDRTRASVALLESVRARAEALLAPGPPLPEPLPAPTPPAPTSAPPTSPAPTRSPGAAASPRASAPSPPAPSRTSARPAQTTARPAPSRPVPRRSLPAPPVPPTTPAAPSPPSPPAPTLPSPPTPART